MIFSYIENRANKKRVNIVCTALILIFLALMYRLYYLSCVVGESYAKAAVTQRKNDVNVKKVRGTIYDRNMVPLTETEASYNIAFSKSMLDTSQEFKNQLLLHVGVTEDELNKHISDNEGPYLLTLNTIDRTFINLATRYGAKIISTDKRYSDFGVASHLIGFSPEDAPDEGIGIERAFDDILSADDYRSIGVIRDGGNNPITGITDSYRPDFDGLKLTIDYHAQKAVEEIMDEHTDKAAIIVTEASTGDVLAMASRGNFQPNSIGDYLSSSGGEMLNRAVAAYDGGSVFKIITASAAIENNLINENTFYLCEGHIDIDGRDFYCNERNGHGYGSFEQAFAYSCNIPFYQIGSRLGFETLNDYAKKFGLGERVFWFNNFGEQAGVLPNGDIVNRAMLANMAIGQGETLVTPLQITGVVLTVANDGVKMPINVVDSYTDKFGNVIEPLRKTETTRVINQATAKRLQDMMDGVVSYGTGKNASPSESTAAGKTSTAETGWMEDGELKIHAWFAGYTPSVNPRYVICVFVENGRFGSQSAAPLFKKIADRLNVLFPE